MLICATLAHFYVCDFFGVLNFSLGSFLCDEVVIGVRQVVFSHQYSHLFELGLILLSKERGDRPGHESLRVILTTTAPWQRDP